MHGNNSGQSEPPHIVPTHGQVDKRTCTLALAVPVWLAASVAVSTAVQLAPVVLKRLRAADELEPVETE